MRKVLFAIITIYMIIFLGWGLPAFSVSKVTLETRYAATEKEKTMIKDVYDIMMFPTTLCLWSLLGVYGAFGASMFLDRKNKRHSDER